MRFADLMEASMTFYHGSTKQIDNFTLDFVGRKGAVDQEGPGIYLTSSVDDAKMYGEFVHTVKASITKSKLMPDTKSLSIGLVRELISKSPAFEDNMYDWDESPTKGLVKAANAIMQKCGPNQYREAMEQIWYDHYRGYEKEWLNTLVGIGWDGFILSRPGNVSHFICFNPNILTIENVVVS